MPLQSANQYDRTGAVNERRQWDRRFHAGPESAVRQLDGDDSTRDARSEVDVAVIIPAYNEAGGVGSIVRRASLRQREA